MAWQKLEGGLLENRVILWYPEAASLFDESNFGTPIPEDNPLRLELDLFEATYLSEKERLSVFSKLGNKKTPHDVNQLIEYAMKFQDNFLTKLTVYRDLRNRGYVVRSGLIYGAAFRVYDRGVKMKRGPKEEGEHTAYIVQPVPEEKSFDSTEFSRAVRLTQNIRAGMIWAIVSRENGVTYYEVVRKSL